MKKLNKIFGVLNNLHDALLMIAFVIAIIISGYGMCDVWYVYSHVNDSFFYGVTPDSSSFEPEQLPLTDGLTGWIYFEDTDIHFPVMQGENNLAFLNKDPYGNFSLSGSIFLDSRNSPDFADEYSMIYGHHMEYGKMFGALDAYLDRDYAAKHRIGTLLIGRDGSLRSKLTVFAVLRTGAKELAAFDVENPQNAREFILSHAQIMLGQPATRYNHERGWYFVKQKISRALSCTAIILTLIPVLMIANILPPIDLSVFADQNVSETDTVSPTEITLPYVNRINVFENPLELPYEVECFPIPLHMAVP